MLEAIRIQPRSTTNFELWPKLEQAMAPVPVPICKILHIFFTCTNIYTCTSQAISHFIADEDSRVKTYVNALLTSINNKIINGTKPNREFFLLF